MSKLAGKTVYCIICLFLLAWGLGCQGGAGTAGEVDDSQQAVLGYFAAQDLPETLAVAASSMQSDTDIRPMLSAVVMENNRAKVDFSPPVYPKGLSFGLEKLNSQGRSDTIMFTLQVPRNGSAPQNELVMFCLTLIMNTTSPAMDEQGLADVDKILANGGVAMVDGWEYNALYDELADPMTFTFSAQKLPEPAQP